MTFIDNISQFSSTTSLTFDHAVSSQEAVLVVSVAIHQGTTTSVQYNGVPLTLLANAHTAFNETAEIWIMSNPPVGVSTISVTQASGSLLMVSALSVLGISKKSLTIPGASANGSSSQALVSISPQTANSLIIDVYSSDAAAGNTAFAEQTQYWALAGGGGENGGGSYRTLSTEQATNMAWNLTSGQRWAQVAVALPLNQAYSAWFPSISARHIRDTNVQDTLFQNSATTNLGYKPAIFYQNSFLHTVGRMAAGSFASGPYGISTTNNIQSEITVQNYIFSNMGTGTPVNFTITSPDEVLVVFTRAQAAGATSPALNGIVLTQLRSESFVNAGTTWGMNIYYMANPPVGRYSLVLNNGTAPHMFAISLSGVNKNSNPLTFSTGTGGTQGTALTTLPIYSQVASGLVIDSITALSGAGAQIDKQPSANQTLIFKNSNQSWGMSYANISNSENTLSWNLFGGAINNQWLQQAIVLEPAKANSTWFPNIRTRNYQDTLRPFDQTASTTVITNPQLPAQFFQNSFLHTVGRIIKPPPIVLATVTGETEQATSQIIIDRVFQGQSSGGSTLNMDVSIPSPDAILVVTGGSAIATGGAWQSVQFNGNPLIQLVGTSQTGTDAEIWYYPYPPVGVGILSVVPAATFGQVYANAMVILGADKRSTNIQVASATNTASTSIGALVTPDAPNSLLIDVLSTLNVTTFPVQDSSETVVFNSTPINTGEHIMSSYKIASTAQNMNYNLSTAVNASLVTVSFRPAAAPSQWFPNIDLRQLDDTVTTSGLDASVSPVSGQYGYKPATFYQNSFLHTVGRIIPPSPPIPLAISIFDSSTVTDNFGYSLVFNGSSNYLTIADSSSLDITGNITIEATINYPVSGENANAEILKKDGQYILRLSGDATKVEAIIWTSGSGFVSIDGLTSLTPGQHHVGLTYDGSLLRVLLDGTVDNSASVTGTITTGTNSVGIGADTGGGEYFKGGMDEIRVSDVARYTGSYAIPPSEFTNDAHTKLLLHFDEGLGTNTVDSSGNNNTPTFSSPGPSWTTGLVSTSGNVVEINEPVVFDSSAVTENVTINMPININVFDSSTATDVPTVVNVYNINVFDSSAVTENITMLQVLPILAGASWNNTSQIIFDDISTSDEVSNTTVHFSHRVNSQDAVLLILGYSTKGLPTLVNFNGVSLTNLVSATEGSSGNSYTSSIWYMVNPPVGTYTVDMASTGNLQGQAMTILGVNKKALNPITASTTASTFPNGTVSLQITPTSANSVIIDNLLNGSGNGKYQVDPSQTMLSSGENTSPAAIAASFKVTSGGPQTMQWTQTAASGGSWAYTAVALEPAQAPSIWFPAIANRNINDVNVYEWGETPYPFQLGYKPTSFYLNSFLHTVGRTNMGTIPPVVTPQTLINLSQGLVAYYPFDDNQGSTARDALNTFPGQWQGTLGNQWKSNGKINSSGLFNGSDNYITSNALVVNPSVGYSLSFWIYPFPEANNTRFYSEGTNSSGVPNFGLGFATVGGGLSPTIFFHNDANTNMVSANGNTILNPNNWYHIVWTDFNGATVLYINGVPDSANLTYTPSGTFSFTQSSIGNLLRNSSAGFFPGNIDGVGIWNRQINSFEVQALYGNGQGIAYPFVNNTFSVGIQGYNYYSNAQYDNWQTSFLQTIGRLLPPPVSVVPLTINVFDSSTATDVPTVVNVYNINVFDSSAVTDVVVQILQTYFISVFDSSTATDVPTVVNVYNINVFDSSAVTDVIAQILEIYFINIFDSSVVTENVTLNVPINISVEEDSAVTDAVTILNIYLINVFDGSTVTENIAAAIPLTINVFDSSAVTEAVTMLLIDFVSVEEDSAVTENVTFLTIDFISIFDTSTATDVPVVELVHEPNVFDSSKPTDSIVQILQIYNINVFDSSVITENIVIVIPTFFISVEDDSVATDVPVLEVIDTINVFDSSAVTEAVTMLLIDFVSVEEDSAVTESVTVTSAQGSYSPNVSDSSAVTDVVTLNVPINISVEDDSAVTDAVTTEISEGGIIFDSSTVTDVVTTRIAYFINIFDSSTATDVLSGQNGGIYLNPLDISIFDAIGPYLLIFVDGRPALRLTGNFYTFI